MSASPVLKAWLEVRGDGTVKVRWTSRPANAMPRAFEYFMSVAQLSDCVSECRKALEVLQDVADDPSESGLPRALRRVAQSGETLYNALMFPDAGKPDDAKPFREWFEANVAAAPRGGWRIEFQHQQAETAVPWGLTCPPGAIRTSGVGFDDYADLWAHRYTAASYFGADDSGFGAPEVINGREFQCSLLVERSDRHSGFALEAADHSENLTLWLSGQLLDHTIDRVSALRERFRENRLWNHIVYLNLRSTGDHYSFPNDEETLTPGSLASIASILKGRSRAIAMIDREAIIRGDRGQKWLDAFFGSQWAGLIAAETDINAKALRFRGFRFLMELLAPGVILTQSLVAVRKLLWPYSLLYGVYSNPERIFVAPTPEVVKELRAALEKHG